MQRSAMSLVIYTYRCSTSDSNPAQHAAERHVTCQCLFKHARTCTVRKAEKDAPEVLSEVLHIYVYMHMYAYTL